METGVNARLLGKPFTGIGQYTRNLFKNLAKIDFKNEYVLVTPEPVSQELAEEFPKNVRIHVLKERYMISKGMGKTWWEQIQVPAFLQKEKVDFAFFPYPANPWDDGFYKSDIKTFVTVHDCIPWMKKSYRKGMLSDFYYSKTKEAVNKAHAVLTVSQASKMDIVDLCRVDPNKVHVIYNDADEIYKEPVSENFRTEILAKFGLKKNMFFLYCGGYDERKNVDKLLDEYAVFRGEHKGISLVLVGGKLFEDKLYKSFDSEKEGVLKTGFLYEKELKVLYESCLAFVHFSGMEGFNIPLLEAANCGAPLIISDIPVHREIAGDSALFVELEKSRDGAKKMAEMLEKEVRDVYCEKSRELAKKYSWNVSAQNVKEMLSLF